MQRFVAAGILVLAAIPSFVSSGQAQETQESCVTCHSMFDDERLAGPVEKLREDVHGRKGFGCVACHGGDGRAVGLAAMDPDRGYIGVPDRQGVAALCGRCHSNAEFMRRFDPTLRVDQVAEYRTSIHGQRLLEFSDTLVATCVGCHPAHSIKPPSDPSSSVHPINVAKTCATCHAESAIMAPYGIRSDQYQGYLESVHWEMVSVEGELSAPTCNDCHGNHGAAPPGVSWVGNVCGHCHTVMGEMFAESFHSQVFTLLGSPGCATCHGNHRIRAAGDELLGLEEGAACANCHTASDEGGSVAATMRSLIDSLTSEFDKASAILARAENAGTEVSEARFTLNGATTALISARTAVHSFSIERVSTEVDAGLEATSEAYAYGERALGDLRFRRLGLAVSVSIILVLIGGLVIKIRQLEAKATVQPAQKKAL